MDAEKVGVGGGGELGIVPGLTVAGGPMGMVLEIFGARASTLRRLANDPPLVHQLISPDEPEFYENAHAEARRARSGFLARLFGARPTPDDSNPVAPLDLSDDETLLADLDKSWHGLHYLLVRKEWDGDPPLDFLAAGGEMIGNVDVGYGPARAVAPEIVKLIYTELSKLSDDALRARFNPSDMVAKKIYPDSLWSPESEAEDDGLPYLMENLKTLRASISKAASRGLGLVLVLR